MIKHFLLIVATSFLFSSCQDEVSYLHIAHTRSYDGAKDKLMNEVEQLDFDAYEVLMLGGDLVYESSGKKETLDHLDEVFDLSKDNVLWTLGNHDYQNHPEWISEVTKRPNSYVFHKNNITYLVLDSQKDNCNTTGVQKDRLAVTIELMKPQTTHFVILHHKLVWMMDGGDLEKSVNSVSNGEAGTCFHCVMPNDFYETVYPQLVEVKKKGIEVICIAGDIGVKKDEFEHKTKEGIYFLASGLKDKSASNKVLLFNHNLTTGNLTWEFKPLEDLATKKY